MRRGRVTALLAALLFAVSAVPVLAEESTPASSDAPGGEQVPLPGPADIAAGIEQAEREEAERQRWLASAGAVRQREESRRAFADLSAADSKELLIGLFSEQLKKLNADPARWLSDAGIVDLHGQAGATVRREGDTTLLTTAMPLRARDEAGELRKLDLTLQATPGGLKPANPLVELQIPDRAGGRIQIGEQGLAATPLGSEEGRDVELLGDKNAFYADVFVDTDRVVAPTSTGVEIFDLLRSAASPEVFRFQIDVPEGAELQPDEIGGARVVRDGEQIASIPFPHAVDAQGTPVPVELELEGKTIALRIAHRQAEVAYPLLLDPAIVNDYYNYNWFNGHNLDFLINGTWNYHESHSWIEGFTSCQYSCFGPSGRALYISMMPGAHNGGEWGQWVFRSPNANSFLAGAWANPFVRDDHNCPRSQYPQPHDYLGMWHNGAWNSPLRIDQAAIYGYTDANGWGSALVIGMGTGGGSAAPCRRDLAVGGAAVWEDDWQQPSIDAVSGMPSGWIDGTTPISVSVEARDDGLGLSRVSIHPEANPEIAPDNADSCSGLAGNRCPTTKTAIFSFTGASLREGVRSAQISAEDPTGKASSTYQTQTKVDRSPPAVTLSGQLAQATGEGGSEEKPPGEGDELSLPVYNLRIEAEDGSNAEDKTKRSGVKDIDVFLDGESMEVPWQAQSCPESSCGMTETYTLELSRVATAGEHTLEVDVVDQVGNVRERNIEFEYFPATGIKDEYVMHYFPLPDGQGDEEEEEHPARPELAVNVMNGNLVYRERDVDVEGPAVDLEVERYYNSMLPDSESTEWGDGWTLAQTPKLKPEEGATPPSEGEFTDSSGVLAQKVALPTETEGETFDPELQATISKTASGYELTDETGEAATSVAFDEAGRTEALLTEGPAKLDYSYEAGELAEIAVVDPATVRLDPEEAAELEPDAPEGPIYASSFGSYGSADGQLRSPGDVAVDPQGNIWVVDKSNNRIQKFGPGGQFLAKFGSSGSADGQFNRPTAIAIAPGGDLLVTDAGNSRVQRFTPAGAFVSKFGSSGSGNGQFSGWGPEGIAVDSGGDIWVSDTYAGRVQEFSPTGEFLQVVGSKGSGEGQIGEPTGIDFDPEGNLWVADWQNNRVEVFGPGGEFLDQFGSQGTGDGQFNRPDALDIDSDGNVWVGDQNNGRIQRFDLTGQYVGQFGAPGSGEGQFKFTYPMGIAADDDGHIWIADVNNHRIQEWAMPDAQQLFTAHAAAFGSAGSGAGELEAPADVAIDPEGGLWVADKGNDRIQHFDAAGSFVSQFGATGSGDGQLSAPSGIDLDPEGNIWVADTGNDRIQKFSPEGEFLRKVGTTGTGNGQFQEPVGIAVAPNLIGIGGFYVVDRGNHRVQLFGIGGSYWGQGGSYGAGEKQLIEPSAIALGGPSGEASVTVLIADSGNHRVKRMTWDGKFVTKFGTLGTGKGQLNRPEAIEVDEQGSVWVGDRVNDRVEVFDEEGKSLGEFGSQGTGEGELELTYPIGIAAAEGEVWVTDSGNDRLQRWAGFKYAPAPEAPPLEDDDPRVSIASAGGLVSSVEGEEAGEHSYVHEGDDLVSHNGPDGETTYDYDAEGRLTKVTLANGTWGEVAYHADGRAKSVTVDPAGEEPAKTTQFEFSDEPRRTTVIIPGAPNVVYEIGADGSVLKWWNVQEPPVFDDIAGTLYDNREKPQPISSGVHNLYTQAHSPHGIASIEVIANGTELIDERLCEQTEEPGIECVEVVNEWVTETSVHPPGRLDLEVIITDRLGNSASERFWVEIPQPPPPPAPGSPVPPTYGDIAEFREEYGLEVVFPVKDEIELNERIFNLIAAWNNPHTPAGEVARASWGRWGVPLRAADVAELEYRDWLYDVNGDKIDQWAQTSESSTYAGY